MPAFATTGALPRAELALAVVEGEGQVGALIGEQVLGPLGINYRNAHYIKATLADSLGLRPISADKYIHAPGAGFPRLSATLSDGSITITPRGVELPVPNEMILDYREFNVLAFFCARLGRETTALTKEKLIADAIFSTGNFGSATNSAVAYTAALNSTCSFIGDVIASTRRLKAKGEAGPYKVVVSGTVFERIRQSAAVQAYVAGTLKSTSEVTRSSVAEALKEFGVDELLIGDSYYNATADQASLASTALTAIWSTTYVWVGKAGMSTTGGDSGGAGVPLLSGCGANVFWENYSPGGITSTDKDSLSFPGGNFIETYPSNETDSLIIRVKMSHKPQITNARAGDLIATQYS